MFSSIRSPTSFESERSTSDLPPIYSSPFSSRPSSSSSSSSATYSPLQELQLSPYLEGDSPLPLYTNSPTTGEVVLNGVLPVRRPEEVEQDASGMRYKYKSSRMKLDLGARGKGVAYTHCPSYGYGGVIEGFVEIKSLKNVEKVELKIEGVINLAATERGYVASTGAKTILSHTEVIYSTDSPAASDKSIRHDISFPIPSRCAETSNPLPPSLYLLFPGVECHVAYNIKVEMYKKGFRRHETVETAFLYLPKTSPPARRSELSSYSSASSSAVPDEKSAFTYSGWKTSVMSSAEPLDAVKDLFIEMGLQRPLSYKSKTPIPVRLIFSNTSDPIIPDLIASNATISLYKITTLTISGRSLRREQLMGKGKFGKAIRGHKETNVVIAEGSVVGGKANGESAWRVDGIISVDYAIRVEVTPTQSLEGVLPCYKQTEFIELTTHSWEEAFHRDGILEGPALGIIGRGTQVASN